LNAPRFRAAERNTLRAIVRCGKAFFSAEEVGATTTGRIDAFYRLLDLGLMERITMAGCKWWYRLTDAGRAAAATLEAADEAGERRGKVTDRFKRRSGWKPVSER